MRMNNELLIKNVKVFVLNYNQPNMFIRLIEGISLRDLILDWSSTNSVSLKKLGKVSGF